jgi:hypothetical protein
MKVDFSKVKHGNKIKDTDWQPNEYCTFLERSKINDGWFYAQKNDGIIIYAKTWRVWHYYEEPKSEEIFLAVSWDKNKKSVFVNQDEYVKKPKEPKKDIEKPIDLNDVSDESVNAGIEIKINRHAIRKLIDQVNELSRGER